MIRSTLRQVEVVAVVFSAPETVSQKLKEFLKKIGIVIQVEVLQKNCPIWDGKNS